MQAKKSRDAGRGGLAGWCPRQESNLYLPLRRGPFYPLNYGDNRAQIVSVAQGALICRQAAPKAKHGPLGVARYTPCASVGVIT